MESWSSITSLTQQSYNNNNNNKNNNKNNNNNKNKTTLMAFPTPTPMERIGINRWNKPQGSTNPRAMHAQQQESSQTTLPTKPSKPWFLPRTEGGGTTKNTRPYNKDTQTRPSYQK